MHTSALYAGGNETRFSFISIEIASVPSDPASSFAKLKSFLASSEKTLEFRSMSSA